MSIYENIFSVTNEDIRKVITILGIKFKFKSKKLEQKKEIKKLEAKIKNLKNKLNKSEILAHNLKIEIEDLQKLLCSKYQLKNNKHLNIIPIVLSDENNIKPMYITMLSALENKDENT